MLQHLSRVVCVLTLALATAAWGAAPMPPAKPAAPNDSSDWQKMKTFPVTSNISCVTLAPDYGVCISATTDGRIQEANWGEKASGGVSLWSKEEVATSAPDCLKMGRGRVDCFFADRNRDLVHAISGMTFQPLGGGPMEGPPSCVSIVPTWIDCFVRKSDDSIHRTFYRGAQDGWSNWEPLPGKITSALSCIKDGRHAIDCFARGEHDELRQNSWNEQDGWTGWEDRGGGLSLRPECVSWEAGRIDCFVRGDKSVSMYHIAADDAGWHKWEPLGGHLSSDLSCVARKANRLDCFVMGPVPGLHHIGWTGTGWTAWENLGGLPTMAPECISVTPDSIDCFIRNEDKTMSHRHLAALP